MPNKNYVFNLVVANGRNLFYYRGPFCARGHRGSDGGAGDRAPGGGIATGGGGTATRGR